MDNIIGNYFNSLSDLISAKSQLASMTPHRPDIGSNKEDIIIELLNNHIPERLRAINGGTVIGLAGAQSNQIDVIVKNDLFPRFDQNNKSFVLIDSVASAITVKSMLDTNALRDCLNNLASIPQFNTKSFSLTNSSIIRTGIENEFFKLHPTLAVFAYDGISFESILVSMDTLVKELGIPTNRLPHFVIVNGKYVIQRMLSDTPDETGKIYPAGAIHGFAPRHEQRGALIATLINSINGYNTFLPFMKINYHEYLNEAYIRGTT
jgi:hypothetical protein